MARKIIIENRTDLSMEEAIDYARIVVSQGRISNGGKQYCLGTRFENGITVFSELNKRSDKLIVTKQR
jgi:hypothetical protein